MVPIAMKPSILLKLLLFPFVWEKSWVSYNYWCIKIFLCGSQFDYLFYFDAKIQWGQVQVPTLPLPILCASSPVSDTETLKGQSREIEGGHESGTYISIGLTLSYGRRGKHFFIN